MKNELKTALTQSAKTFLLLGALVLPQAAFSASGSREAPSALWSAKMQELQRVLSQLLTDVSSEKRFQSSENQARILANADKLSRLAHDLGKKGSLSPDEDPTVAILSGLFAEEAKRASRLLRASKPSQRAYARELLQKLPGHCIACHTRTARGPSFAELALSPSVAQLQTIEKARFFAATRQYDRALQEFDRALADSATARDRFGDWQEALRQSLVIAVRVKRDPVLTGKIIDRIFTTEGVPFFIRQDGQEWKKSVQEWSKELNRETLTEEGQHAEAIRLLARAREAQKYPADRSGDIVYLRASAAVHYLLQQGKNSRYLQEAYLMAGVCYDALRSFQWNDLNEIYFESCVRQSPHSTLAQACFRRYEELIYEGFTGSSGTSIPSDMQQKLEVLGKLAQPVSDPVR